MRCCRARRAKGDQFVSNEGSKQSAKRLIGDSHDGRVLPERPRLDPRFLTVNRDRNERLDFRGGLPEPHGMEPVRLSPVRRLLLWWFEPPRGLPYISSTISVDFSSAAQYLAAINEDASTRVSLQHLLTASIARLYEEFPVANRRIVGNRILQLEHVGIASPVNLLGHDGEAAGETSMIFLENVDTLTLREVAAATAPRVAAERSGSSSNKVIRALWAASRHAPTPLLNGVLDAVDHMLNRSLLSAVMHNALPVTTGVSNVGAALGRMEGVMVRSAALHLPARGLHVGTMWGLSSLQDEVIPIDGTPEVRPMLPIIFVFDHRVFDGVIAGRILKRLCEILRDPEAVFGRRGEG